MMDVAQVTRWRDLVSKIAAAFCVIALLQEFLHRFAFGWRHGFQAVLGGITVQVVAQRFAPILKQVAQLLVQQVYQDF